MIEPRIGMKSMIQITKDINSAYSGAMNNKAIKDTMKIMTDTKNCAFRNPKMTLFKREAIKRTFSAVDSFKRLKSISLKFSSSSMNRNSAIKKTIKLTKNDGMPVSKLVTVS